MGKNQQIKQCSQYWCEYGLEANFPKSQQFLTEQGAAASTGLPRAREKNGARDSCLVHENADTRTVGRK